MSTRLTQDFYRRDSIDVARDLLGTVLVHHHQGRTLKGRIVETEAYLGAEDPAAHSFGGRRTPRTEPMFGPAGLSYIYFIYGMYFCFNVVTADHNIPEAVLVRALEPLEGFAELRPDLANGPGKLCRAFHLTKAENGLDLCTSQTLWIEGEPQSHLEIIQGPRIGIGSTHDAVHWPLRFGVNEHPCLSPYPFSF